MTDERRIANPNDPALRDLEDGEIQTNGSTRKDQTARSDLPPTGLARANPPGEKSKEAPRTTSLLPELLQKMSITLDVLLESAERQNKANGTITDELKSLGADYRARVLELGMFRKLVALNFTTPVRPSSQPLQQPMSTTAKDGRSALLAQALSKKGKVGNEPLDVDDDDEDLARRVVLDTELTEPERARRTTTKGRNADLDT
ncbi:hypothetical protein AALP_AA6G195300 [Arabis alpina]|uniref:Uncharacterized protein n=1 Tax=Arabis alpina TaxID=50452 RepID=A0A087GQB5_ARAAL|nr:hypothetical protein AALP_AA6G195300 [Arabis alpina]